MKKEGEQNTEDLKSLFKILQNDNKVYASDIDKLSKRIEKLTEDGSDKDVKDAQSPTRRIVFHPEQAGGDEDSRLPTITHFPNKKTALSFEEFSDLYDQAYTTSLNDDSMISAVFEMFDFDKDGKVDVVNLKKMLEAFGFKVNGQDIRSMLFALSRRAATERSHRQHYWREGVCAVVQENTPGRVSTLERIVEIGKQGYADMTGAGKEVQVGWRQFAR